MPASDFNAQLWSQFTQVIAAKLGQGSTSSAIQVMPIATELPGSGNTDDLQSALAQFANVIPEWGAAGVPSPSTVEDAYRVVLSQIRETATNGSSIEAQYETEQKKLMDMMGQADQYKRDQIPAYIDTKNTYEEAGMPAPTFADWFQDNGLQAYQAKLADQQHQLEVVQRLLAAEGIGSPLVTALNDLNTTQAANASAMTLPVVLNPTADLIAGWKTKPVNPGGMSFSDSDTQYDYSKTVWSKQSGFDLFGFISIGKRDASQKTENILSSQSKFSIDIEFAAQANINVIRNWLNAALLKNYANGPWVSGSSFDQKTAHPFGDANAVFPMMITTIYVVVNPKISITLDLSSYQSVFNEVSDNVKNGINVGPFGFGGSDKGKDTMVCQVAAFKASQTFTIRDNSGIPQIIAVSNQLFS